MYNRAHDGGRRGQVDLIDQAFPLELTAVILAASAAQGR